MDIVLIGLGDIAQKAYLPIMSNIEGVRMGLCTRDRPTLNRLSNRYGSYQSFETLDDVIRRRPDAVMIHSSTSSHYEIALACLNAGIAVFIDKPISYELEKTERLIELSEEKNIPLMVGFNRRYAPLYQPLLQTTPTHLRYQKNRHNMTGDVRQFVYDDFIHILDFALCASKSIEQPSVSVLKRKKNEQLAILDIHWEHAGGLYSLSMNRINGREEERLEYAIENTKWEINEMNDGVHHASGKSSLISFGNWESTLYRRGFISMIDKFVSLVEAQKNDSTLNQQVWQTHSLCEEVIVQLKL